MLFTCGGKTRILWLLWKHIDVLFLVVQPMCGAEQWLVSGGFSFSIPPSFLSSPCQGMVVSYHLFFVSNLVLILLIAIYFVFQGIVVSYHLFFVSNLVLIFLIAICFVFLSSFNSIFSLIIWFNLNFISNLVILLIFSLLLIEFYFQFHPYHFISIDFYFEFGPHFLLFFYFLFNFMSQHFFNQVFCFVFLFSFSFNRISPDLMIRSRFSKVDTSWIWFFLGPIQLI